MEYDEMGGSREKASPPVPDVIPWLRIAVLIVVGVIVLGLCVVL